MIGQSHPTRSGLRARLRGLHQARRCLHGLNGLPCFVLFQERRRGVLEWWELLEDDRRLRPFDFEFRFGLAKRRDVYHAHNLHRVHDTRRPHVGTLFGFSDLYVPLHEDTRCSLAFYAGQWASSLPTYEAMGDIWREISGRLPSPSDPMFVRWVECCLEVPVLDHARVEGLAQMGSLFGQLLSDLNPRTTQSRLDALRKRVFLPDATDHNWIQSCLDTEGLTRPPWGLDPIPDPRLVDELGLRLRPSAVALFMLDATHRDWKELLRARVAARRLQLAASHLCRSVGNCLAGPLGSDAVIVALSLEAGVEGNRRKQKLEALAKDLQRRFLREFHLSTVVGLGLEVVPGDGLGSSYRQASSALAHAVDERIPFARFEERSTATRSNTRRLRERSEAVLSLLERRKLDELAAAVPQLGRDLAIGTRNGPDAIRTWLKRFLDDALARLEEDGTLTEHRAAKLLLEFEIDLDALSDRAALMNRFAEQVAKLIELLRDSAVADRNQRLDSALRWLAGHLDHRDPLAETARRCGLARSSLRREFRGRMGTSFGQWLRETRIEEARRLLVQGDQPVATVARQVGWREVHAFIRAFRAKTGTTPGEYRKEQRRRDTPV